MGLLPERYPSLIIAVFYFWSKLLQIFIIGSTSKLGQWNVQNGLKLSYAGESIWHADCVFPKSDFPIRYPCQSFILDNLTVSLSLNFNVLWLLLDHPSLSSLTDGPRINIANMATQETFLQKMVQTVTLFLTPQKLNQDTFFFQMA